MADNLQLLILAPYINLDLMVNGVLVGAIFALAAYGMALVWGVMNIINIAQGEFVILGGYVTLSVTWAGLNPFLGIPISAATLFVVGWVLYRVVIWRIVDRDLFISILATFGISILLQQLMNQMYSADVVSVQTRLGSQYFFDNIITVSEIKLVGFVFVIVVGVCLVLFLRKSRLGQAIRATAQNARAARIMGIDTDRVYATTFALNAAICGAAGSLVIMTWVIHPYMGLAYTIRSFLIVIVAGLGNLLGVIAAGLGLGAAEQFAGFILGAEFQIAFVFAAMVVFLVFKNMLMRRQRKYLK